MRATKMIAGLFGVALVLSVGAAFATETVVIGGWEITCPSSCVISYGSDGTFSVNDADGGQITARIPPPKVPQEK